MQEAWVWYLCREDPLEKRMTTHSSFLTGRIPWTEEPGGLQSMGSQRVGHDWATFTFRVIPLEVWVIHWKCKRFHCQCKSTVLTEFKIKLNLIQFTITLCLQCSNPGFAVLQWSNWETLAQCPWWDNWGRRSYTICRNNSARWGAASSKKPGLWDAVHTACHPLPGNHWAWPNSPEPIFFIYKVTIVMRLNKC